MLNAPPVGAQAGKTGKMSGQEALLLDYVHRLERHRAERRAVHIHLSALMVENRREHHMRIAASTFDNLVKMLQAQIFTLTNSDLMVIYKSQAQDEVEGCIVKLKFLFSDDPVLVEDQRRAGPSSFCTWYNLEKEYEVLLQLSQKMVQEEETRNTAEAEQAARVARSQAFQKPKGLPFTPELLAQVEVGLARADLANLMRRQSVCAVVGQAPPTPVFNELFISIADLRQTLLPNVNLNSSPWLFQQLTETLDRRVLSGLNKHDDKTLQGDISINLNVSTILSPEFMVFDDNVKPGMRGTIVLELQKVDIFADLGAYLFARDFAHDRGYRICIDGLFYSMLPFVDRERLGADLIKLAWDPSLMEEKDKKTDALRRIGVTRIIINRCDTPSAIEYGHSVGITLFQGRHVDSILSDIRRKGIRSRPR